MKKTDCSVSDWSMRPMIKPKSSCGPVSYTHLNVPADELEKFEDQFNQILNYAEILKQVDTTGIEPSPYVLSLIHIFNIKTIAKSPYFLSFMEEQILL